MATVDDDGMPYCVPLSYVVERGWGSVEGAGEGESLCVRIYIHTTKNDGHKMADAGGVTLACGAAWRVRVEPCYEGTFFATRFASAMVARSHSSRRARLRMRKDARSRCA